MSAGKYDIYIEQGADFAMILTFKSDGENADDLTGRSFFGSIRKKINSSSVLADFSFLVLDQTNPLTKGQVKVFLNSTATSAIPFFGTTSCEDRVVKYPYDIKSIVSGVVYRELEGCIHFSAKVTE